MLSVSVVGFTGKKYLDSHTVSAETLVQDLRAAAMQAMGINGQGLTVKLLVGATVLEDVQTLGDAGVEDGSEVTAIVNDIVSALRAMTELPTYTGDNIAEAASKGAWHDVLRLMEEGKELNATYDYGYSALHHLASVPHATPDTESLDAIAASQLMRWLLMRGADVTSVDHNRKTALHVWGKYGGSLEQGQVLVEYGADVNHAMSGGYTPLWYVRNYRRPMPDVDRTSIGVAGAERRATEAVDQAAAAGGSEEGNEVMWVAAERLLLAQGGEQFPFHFDY